MCLSCASLAHLLHTSRATVERSSKQVRRKPPVACLLPVAHELHPCLISGAAYFSAVAVPLGSPCLRPSADLLSTEGYFVPRNIRKTRGQRFQFPFLPINFRSAGKLNSCQFPRASTALPKVIGRTKWSWQHEALAQCLKTSARHAPLMIPQNPCARSCHSFGRPFPLGLACIHLILATLSLPLSLTQLLRGPAQQLKEFCFRFLLNALNMWQIGASRDGAETRLAAEQGEKDGRTRIAPTGVGEMQF